MKKVIVFAEVYDQGIVYWNQCLFGSTPNKGDEIPIYDKTHRMDPYWKVFNVIHIEGSDIAAVEIRGTMFDGNTQYSDEFYEAQCKNAMYVLQRKGYKLMEDDHLKILEKFQTKI